MGCDGWVQQCQDELRASGVDVERGHRDDVSGALTAQERRVAEAVAEGLSNAQVARRLYLSPRTVEVHLTHAYRKLGVHGRVALARSLSGVP
jgi:DNA-binding NarL/FixJ family response regulator